MEEGHLSVAFLVKLKEQAHTIALFYAITEPLHAIVTRVGLSLKCLTLGRQQAIRIAQFSKRHSFLLQADANVARSTALILLNFDLPVATTFVKALRSQHCSVIALAIGVT